ncbi:MAG TPA: hypothetical protein VMT34_13335 [Aggregatilineales bacterium]|nr:hypothetical protein [Aggregatilineales bacterium]
MRLKLGWAVIASLLIAASLPMGYPASAQTPTVTPYPLPQPNILLIYDKTTIAIINTALVTVSLRNVTFMRAGNVIKYSINNIVYSLQAGHCIQLWTADVHQIIGKPDECGTRDVHAQLAQQGQYFWAADYDKEPFRPQLNGSALTICTAAFSQAERCSVYVPQGDDANKPIAVVDRATGIPMPAGIQVAYDPDQLWIGNFIPDTVLPTQTLRLIYTLNGKGVVWTPAASQWDTIGAWDNRGIRAGECIVLYQDPAKIKPILPCSPIAKAVLADHPWLLPFDVMGPREERRARCGSPQPPVGPVLCLVGG